MARPKKASDPLAELASNLAADHTTKKNKGEVNVAAPAPGTDDAENALTVAVETAVEEGAVANIGPVTNEQPPVLDEGTDEVHDRRLQRLVNIVDEAEFEGGTAFGDARDCMLDLFKHRPKVWSAMSQGEQQDTVRTIEAVVKLMLQKIVVVIAEEGLDSIAATLSPELKVKGDAVEVKLKVDHTDEDQLLQLYRLASQKVIIVSADAKRVMSARKDVKTDADQPELFAPVKQFVSTPAKSGPHPDDDSDLAGGGAEEVAETDETAETVGAQAGADPESEEVADDAEQAPEAQAVEEVEQGQLQPAPTHDAIGPVLIFDGPAEVYLAADRAKTGDDWTEDKANAAWFNTIDEAKVAASDFGDPGEFDYPAAD